MRHHLSRLIAKLLLSAAMVIALPATASAKAPDNYNLEISASVDEDDKLQLEIHNGNKFVVNDLDLSITYKGKKSNVQIGSIARESTWKLGDETPNYSKFNSVGYYEGSLHVIDTSLFDPKTGVYNGETHHALVWPDDDTDAEWTKTITKSFPDIKASVTLKFVAEGPRVAFNGHSFTGYWDSSYYYFRELAKMGGWNAKIAYSYWGGNGIAHHSGILKKDVPTTELSAPEQSELVFNANDYYDYYSVAGNSNEALTTKDGKVGSTNYSGRDTMEQGAWVLYEKAKAKGAQMILWSTRGYRYGFFTDLSAKPWKEGKVGDIYVSEDGKKYTLSLTSEQMARLNAEWYEYLAKNVGDGSSIVAHVGTVYDYINKNYSDKVNPYLTTGQESGDWGHQNNLGNYIAACVYYSLIFGESPEGLGIPESHTYGMDGGSITAEQAAIIQKAAWKVVSGEYTLLSK